VGERKYPTREQWLAAADNEDLIRKELHEKLRLKDAELADARAEVERLREAAYEAGRERGYEEGYERGYARVSGERDRLGATAALRGEALASMRAASKVHGVQREHWDAIDAALAADPDEWLRARIEREVEPYRAALTSAREQVRREVIMRSTVNLHREACGLCRSDWPVLGVERHMDWCFAALSGAPQDGAR